MSSPKVGACQLHCSIKSWVGQGRPAGVMQTFLSNIPNHKTRMRAPGKASLLCLNFSFKWHVGQHHCGPPCMPCFYTVYRRVMWGTEHGLCENEDSPTQTRRRGWKPLPQMQHARASSAAQSTPQYSLWMLLEDMVPSCLRCQLLV